MQKPNTRYKLPQQWTMKNVEQQHHVPPKNFLDYGPTRVKLDTKEPLRA